MTVKDLKEMLNNYNDDAEVVIVDFNNGVTYYDVIIGSDDEDEYEQYCRISF